MRWNSLPRAGLATTLALCLVVVVAGSALAAKTTDVDPVLAARLQLKLDRWREGHRAPGVAAAVRLPDGSLWIGTSGTKTTRKNAAIVKPDTAFEIGSLTKTFMAALILELKDEGKLTLGDRLSRWMPRYPKAGRIKVRMLLNHTSGIFDYFAHPRYESRVFGRPTHNWSVSEILRLRGPRYCPPGACYHYSNTNYVLLGRIVSMITGKSPAWNIRKRFLEPLGLDDTYFQGQEAIGTFAAQGYWTTRRGHVGFSDGSRYRPNTSAATVANAAGAMLASVRDVSDWQDALLGGSVLSEHALAQMTHLDPRSGYGLGMRRAWLGGIRGIGHGGSVRGFVAIMYRLPDQDIDVTILTNLGRTNLQPLADRLTHATLVWLEPPPPPDTP